MQREREGSSIYFTSDQHPFSPSLWRTNLLFAGNLLVHLGEERWGIMIKIINKKNQDADAQQIAHVSKTLSLIQT